MNKKYVMVDKRDKFLYFSNPLYEIVANEFSEVKNALKEIDEFRNSGFYLVGFLSYEAGYGYMKFQHEISKKKFYNLPLVWFGVFPEYKVREIPKFTSGYSISEITPEIDINEYAQKIGIIKELLRNGDTYQVNFTFKVFFKFSGDPFSLFLDLRRKQTVNYAYFINLDGVSILSLSPELFFELRDKRIRTKPMKGTIGRGRYFEEDFKMKERLLNSEKDLAENLMIVDLLRNDLGRISEFGSVNVNKLFQIERYETVFQMTSTISSVVREDKISEILTALFPCGSVTGAPKASTMEIINFLESSPRGIYTGSIGMITKNYSLFNVAIRTPVIIGDRGELGIGGGVTWYSDHRDEYEEALLKAKFIEIPSIDDFKLVETMLLRNGKLYLLDLHLKRLMKSARYFGFKFDGDYIMTKLREVVKNTNIKCKLRVLLDKSGRIEIEAKPLERRQKFGYIKLASERTNSNDVFLFHKTTKRDLYNKYYQRALDEGLVDYIFTNERGDITEGCIHNIIVLKGKRLLTPSRDSGLLKGVMLQYLSKRIPIIEQVIKISDLKESEEIYLCNSVTGIKKVLLLPPQL